MVCKQCGKEFEAGTKFCTRCGAQLVDDFSKLHHASATQPMTPMPPQPEHAPLSGKVIQQDGAQGRSGSVKDRNRIILIGALAGGGAVLLIILIVVIVSVMNNLSGMIDLKGAVETVAMEEEDAGENMPEQGTQQGMVDALSQVVGVSEDETAGVNEEKTAAEPARANRNEIAATPDVYTEYILPESDARFYSKEELSVFDENDLRIARNEIFARHGRMFDDPELREYFYDKSWYEPLYTPEEFDPHMEEILNQYEKANVEAIKDLENGEESVALYIVTVDAPDDYVNLREGPGTDYRAIMKIRNGVVLNIYDEIERGRWLRTEYQGYDGWIAASQVSRN